MTSTSLEPHVAAETARARLRAGLGYGLAAYLMWGLFPLYWPLLEPAGALEILAHRVAWSFLFLALLLTVRRGWSTVGAVLRQRRPMLLLLAAALLVSVNWGTYIWAVNNGHVVESSLGYFINPLVSVLLGVLVLREALRPLQWAAFAIAGVAVAVLTFGYGRLPWVALVLALSFGTYGLMKKLAAVDAVPSLMIETSYLAPVAVAYLVFLQLTGALAFAHTSPGHTVLVAAAGVVTALPLLAFGAAAIRVPLTTIGVLQYVTPVIQFLLGVLLFREPMPPARWAGFVIVWIALALFTYDAVRNSRARSRADELEVAEPV